MCELISFSVLVVLMPVRYSGRVSAHSCMLLSEISVEAPDLELEDVEMPAPTPGASSEAGVLTSVFCVLVEAGVLTSYGVCLFVCFACLVNCLFACCDCCFLFVF